MDVSDLRAIEGRRRVVIENVKPQIDCGRFAVKRVVGQRVKVTADVFGDGHDSVRAALLTRRRGDSWRQQPMAALGNDAWQAEFTPAELGVYEYTIVGWVDAFETWHHDLEKRLEAGQEVSTDLVIGSKIVAQAAERADGADADRFRHWQTVLAHGAADGEFANGGAHELVELMSRYPDLRHATRREPPLTVIVDRQRAAYSTWYELFPRSTSGEPGRHGTFRDTIAWLPRLAELGFDVLYLPPIHPIGDKFRKGKNNAIAAAPGDVGSPWAIGSAEGGHRAIHPQLGSLADLQVLIAAARDHGIELRSTSLTNVRPTTRTPRSIPSGFAIGRTARSSTPKTRPRNIRTSTRSISRAPPGPSCGAS